MSPFLPAAEAGASWRLSVILIFAAVLTAFIVTEYLWRVLVEPDCDADADTDTDPNLDLYDPTEPDCDDW